MHPFKVRDRPLDKNFTSGGQRDRYPLDDPTLSSRCGVDRAHGARPIWRHRLLVQIGIAPPATGSSVRQRTAPVDAAKATARPATGGVEPRLVKAM